MATHEEQLAEVERRLDNTNPMDVVAVKVEFDPSGMTKNLFNVSADAIGRLWCWDHIVGEMRLVYDPRDSRC